MTLFDTSVIIDARDAQSPWHQWAKEKIAECCSTDGAGINAVVVAEASVRVEQREHFARHLEQTGMTLLPLPVSAALPAARAYALYLDRLKADGKTPVSKTPLGDFFIGAHAEAEKLPLVTRDTGRVKTYFPKVRLITPD